jgi:hypothetical protein
MKIQVSELKTKRQWRSATGLDKQKFYELLVEYEKCYLKTYGAKLSKRKAETRIAYCIRTEEEQLLFTLFSLKSGLTYDVLGLVCGMNGANAKRNQTAGLQILTQSLKNMGHAPKRQILTVTDLEACFPHTDELLMDATEQRIQHSSIPQKQKEYFSGKKKCHTVKSLIISDKFRRIGYISCCTTGKQHDYGFLKQLFSPKKPWFENFYLRVDLGYLGIAKDYVCKGVSIPHKKPRKAELTETQVEENKLISAARVPVEHSIGGIKRFRVLSDRLRIHDLCLYDHILGVCAALWNFLLVPSNA